MSKHGSGQACRKARITPSCEECRAYARQRSRLEYHQPGYARRRYTTGDYNTDRTRYARRRARIASLDKELETLRCPS